MTHRARGFDIEITAIRRSASGAADNGTEAGDPGPDRTYIIEDIDAALAVCDCLVIAWRG